MPGWAGHQNTASRMWCWRPPVSTAFPPVQRRQAAQGLQGAEMPQHAHMGAEWYPGLHRPPSCPAELPMYAKDNWPNGLPLPHWPHMEWEGWKSLSSEYWSDALIDTCIWIYQGSHMAEGLECLVWGFACAASAQNLATTERGQQGRS